jgi:hypothetical protein
MATIPPVRVASLAMRTRFEIVLWDETRGDGDLRAAGEEALREITDAETLLSAYRPDADLYQTQRPDARYRRHIPFSQPPRPFLEKRDASIRPDGRSVRPYPR